MNRNFSSSLDDCEKIVDVSLNLKIQKHGMDYFDKLQNKTVAFVKRDLPSGICIVVLSDNANERAPTDKEKIVLMDMIHEMFEEVSRLVTVEDRKKARSVSNN